MEAFNILVDPTDGLAMTLKLDKKANYELVSPYFNPNQQLNYTNYRFYYMYITCDVFETICYIMRLFNILVDSTGGLAMTAKLEVRPDLNYFHNISAQIGS